MDRFLAPQSPEALAHTHLTYVSSPMARLCCSRYGTHPRFPHSENWFTWDQDHPSLDEPLAAGCATYEAFKRYLNGADLYLVPRTRGELESVL